MAIQGITRANFGQYFMPVAWNHINLSYGDTQKEYSDIFADQKTTKAAEYSLYSSGLGAAMQFDELQDMPLDRAAELGTSRIMMEKVGLGYALSYETIEDEQLSGINSIMSRLSTGVGKGLAVALNLRGFLLFNEATTAGRTYYDGKTLAATDHPMTNGQVINNLTTNDLSETTVKDAHVAIANLKDDRGLPGSIKARSLTTTKENMFRAKEIFESALSTVTATVGGTGITNTNNINSVAGSVSGGVKTVNYLSNPKAWMIITDAPNGFVRYDRKAKTNADWDVPGNQYHVYSAYQRDAFYCGDPARAVYFGNPA